MKLIKPSFKIITPINGDQILIDIEKVARTCYKSEDKIRLQAKDENGLEIESLSAKTLISKLIKSNHEAMLEFGPSITVRFICDRGVSHELVRHRLASFAQESTRYCNYGKDEHIEFIIPSWINTDSDIYPITWKNKIGACMGVPFKYHTPEDRWFWSMAITERDYNRLLKEGWTPQQARSVLPNSLKTEINVKANIREWRHIFKLRTASGAHPQMRELMCPLLDKLKSKMPILFDDINYK